jgi:Electron transfer DM13
LGSSCFSPAGSLDGELPASVDLARYRAVTIWCKRFSVNFATAPLTLAPGAVLSTNINQGGNAS